MFKILFNIFTWKSLALWGTKKSDFQHIVIGLQIQNKVLILFSACGFCFQRFYA